MISHKELRRRQRRNNRTSLKSKRSRRRFIDEVKKYIKQLEYTNRMRHKILSERLFQEFIEEGDTLGCYFKMLERSNRTLLG